jgi:hypothetical protein
METTMTEQVRALAALCVWEEIIENPESYPGVENYRANHGVCETRDRVIEMARVISEAWAAALARGYDDPFDFEFVPLALRYGSSAANADAPSIEYPKLGMLPVYQKDPAMLGHYLTLLQKAERKRKLVDHVLHVLADAENINFTPADVFWTPERIDSLYNHEVTK